MIAKKLAALSYWYDITLWGLLSRYLRWFYDWHLDYGHPYEQPWPGETGPGNHWGPRHEWVCDLGDKITRGWLHD